MRFRWSVPTAALAAAITFAAPNDALAQESNEVSSTGKGITGGALLGAEAVMLVEAAFGVQPTWAYVVGGLAGGVGGGVAGFFVEDSDPKISLYLLAGGMALAIPTTVAVLSAKAYTPPASYTEDTGPTDEPVAEPPEPDAAPAEGAKKKKRRQLAHRTRPTLYAPSAMQLTPPALLAYDQGNLLLSVPAVEVRDVFTKREMAEFGQKQKTEIRVPVLKLSF